MIKKNDIFSIQGEEKQADWVALLYLIWMSALHSSFCVEMASNSFDILSIVYHEQIFFICKLKMVILEHLSAACSI